MDAPFVSSLMRIEPQWIDYNGHLNVAYYNVLFDRAVDEVYELIGLGPELSRTAQALDHGRRGARALSARIARERSGAGDGAADRLRCQAHSSVRAIGARRRGLGVRHVGDHDIARGHDGQESRAVSRKVCRRWPAESRAREVPRRKAPADASRCGARTPRTMARRTSLRTKKSCYGTRDGAPMQVSRILFVAFCLAVRQSRPGRKAATRSIARSC